MTPEQKAMATQILQMNAVEYWHQVDMNGGTDVSQMFTADGVFHVGPGEPLIGREAIESFYSWRVDRGARTSRHIITNFRAEFTDENTATTSCVMMLMAADGVPVHDARLPLFLGDQIDDCVKCEDGIWRYARRDFTALFIGGEATTTPPASIAQENNIKA